MKNKISVATPVFLGNEKKYLMDCLESGWISSLGSYIDKFEETFAKYIGTKYAVAVSNGTVAIHLLLKALNISEGDEVIIPDLTFIATANSVSYTGATPVFVDSECNSWNISPDNIIKKITKKTKAVICVHLYGQPCDMKNIMRICRQNKIYLIEDCAEAHGAEFLNKKVGSFGIGGTYSFYGNKIITTGEGGMIVTNNKRLFFELRHLRDHAMSKTKRYYHTEIGYNYRMTNLQAAIGLAQLENIQKILDKKRHIENEYNKYLCNIKEIELQNTFADRKKVCWLYSVLIKSNNQKNRDNLMKYLETKGVDTRPFFIPMTQLPPYKSNNKNSNALLLSNQGLNLPTSYNLTDNEIEYICQNIKLFFSNKRIK
ncbi:MAG TPA: DegT/DnrJ/EryC1/StrS family aminotransferase [bacterium]|nr:DegT/DnrJ/EryC1/StrS family aminotransferase [bacterium]